MSYQNVQEAFESFLNAKVDSDLRGTPILNRDVIPENMRSYVFMGFYAAWESQQANIDNIMLEHCPEEMTPEQTENWSRHQKPVPEEEQKRLNEVLSKMFPK